MILIDQIPKVCKIKLNAQCFCAIATAELFQAECKMDLIDEKKSMMNLQFGLQLFYTTVMDHNS